MTQDQVPYKEEVLVLLTRHTADSQIADGYTSDFVFNAERAAKCRFAILTRNAKDQPVPYEGTPHPEPHLSAFLLVKIKGCTDFGLDPKSGKRRYLVQFDEYHHLANPIPDVWPGNRNPVAYLPMAEARARLNGRVFEILDWTPRPLKAAEGAHTTNEPGAVPTDLAATIALAAQQNISTKELNAVLVGYLAGRMVR